MKNTIAGFRTYDQHGSIYAFDEHGHTIRHNLSGHSSHGKIEAPCKCIFLTKAQSEIVHDRLNDTNSKIRILYLDSATRELHTWQGNDLPDTAQIGIGIFDKNSEELIDSWPASIAPQPGMFPFEMRYFRDAQNQLQSQRHLGHPVYEIYQSKAELDNALSKSEFKSKHPKPPTPSFG